MSLLPLVFFSCEKDGEEAVVRPQTAPSLTSSATTAVLLEENEAEEALVLSWSAADYGYQAAVEYVLQVETSGGDFSDPLNIDMGNELEKAFSVEELNSTAIRLGLLPEEEGQLLFRVMSAVSPLVERLASETAGALLTPYSASIEPAFIYVPGAYQGWEPNSAAPLVSPEDNGVYVGIVPITGSEEPADLEFKITMGDGEELTWYGDGGDGKLSTSGENLSVAEPGTYEFTVNMNELTWSARRYSWGVIGDATGSWEVDQDMTYHYEEGVWKLTIGLTAGTIKFRLNDDWGTNYGDDDPGNEQLDFNSPNNIPVAEAGTYEIVLNLQDPENPVYSLTKQ